MTVKEECGDNEELKSLNYDQLMDKRIRLSCDLKEIDRRLKILEAALPRTTQGGGNYEGNATTQV